MSNNATTATPEDRRYEHYKEYGRRNGYASAEQLMGPDGQPLVHTYALADITERDLPGVDDAGNSKIESKQILWFRPRKAGKEPPPPMIVGKEVWLTIASTFAKFFGPKPKEWCEKGLRITFTAEQTNKPRKGDWGIRPVGSPDIPSDNEVTIRLGTKGGGKRTVKRIMRRTDNGGPPTSRSPKEPQ